jgi:hypothetical protein
MSRPSIQKEMKTMKKILALTALALLFTASLVFAANSNQGTTSVQVSVVAEASIVVDTQTTILTSGSTVFDPYLGTTDFHYTIRTAKSGTGSTGNIKVLFADDLKDGGGDMIAVATQLSYTCTVGAPGTGCSGSQAASTTTAGPVATFTADNHGNNVDNHVSWTLINDPKYVSDPSHPTYSATATFTISLV